MLVPAPYPVLGHGIAASEEDGPAALQFVVAALQFVVAGVVWELQVGCVVIVKHTE
jgi:phage-related protein